jgi:predicted transcriptional regulator
MLVSYAASALLLPYDAFRAAAEELRYDVERLQRRFGASFEQVCHRLTTLRRPGHEGVPFHFLRRDAAGNLSKRFSASGLQLPHYGAACARWALHAAFLTPGRIVAQIARMPDDSRYLFIARTTAAPGGHAAPAAPKAVMLGCALAHGARTVYAAGAVEAPVGVTCSLCPRQNCADRAAPSAQAEQPAMTAPTAADIVAGNGR